MRNLMLVHETMKQLGVRSSGIQSHILSPMRSCLCEDCGGVDIVLAGQGLIPGHIIVGGSPAGASGVHQSGVEQRLTVV